MELCTVSSNSSKKTLHRCVPNRLYPIENDNANERKFIMASIWSAQMQAHSMCCCCWIWCTCLLISSFVVQFISISSKTNEFPIDARQLLKRIASRLVIFAANKHKNCAECMAAPITQRSFLTDLLMLHLLLFVSVGRSLYGYALIGVSVIWA